MAKAYQNCEFYGFDNHAASIEYARNKAREEGLDDDRIRFEVASSTNFPSPTAATEERKKGEDGRCTTL
jgi:23S rRNA G2445 N2-methylase RlmL